MKNTLIYSALLLFVAIGCSQNAQNADYAEPSYQNDAVTESIYEEEIGYKSEGLVAQKDGHNKNLSTDDLKTDNPFNAKIIRNADLKFKVDDVKKSSTKIANLVDMNGGYVSSEDLISDKNHYQTIESTEESETIEYEIETSNIIYIRVPSNNFQKLLSSMKGLSISEDYVKINAQDVTEEYYDLETRLKTKKEVETRYIAILKAKAKTLEEILIAEDKIRVIREEIEAVEGKLNYLKNKVNLSTIQIEIYQDPIYTQTTTRFNAHKNTGSSFGEKAGDAFSAGWNGILFFLIVIVYLWPLFVIGGFAFWFVRRKIRNYKALKK
jgi:hypothetical protein